MEQELIKEAYKLRFEYYNYYENKEEKWHEKYKNHKLYKIVNDSLQYTYKQIGTIMPKLIHDLCQNE